LEKVNLILENGGSLKDTNDLVIQERVSNYLESGEEKALLEKIENEFSPEYEKKNYA
jgi:hypothetical protein